MRYRIEIEGDAERTLRELPIPTRSRVIGELRYLAQTEGERANGLWLRLAGLPETSQVCVDGHTVVYETDEVDRVLRVRALLLVPGATTDQSPSH